MSRSGPPYPPGRSLNGSWCPRKGVPPRVSEIATPPDPPADCGPIRWNSNIKTDSHELPTCFDISSVRQASKYRERTYITMTMTFNTADDVSRPPLPPFTEETAQQKVKAAQNAWNTK
jgi:uncharacterized protein DUF1348